MSTEISDNLIIRSAGDKDSTAITKLIFDIWTREYHFDVKKEDYPDLHNIEHYYNKAGRLFLVAEIDGVIVGTIASDKLTANHYVLKRMFVKHEYRGLGIAQTLLDKLFLECVYSRKNLNVSFYLSTKEDEALAAKRFYLKNGFRRIQSCQLPKNFPFFYQDDLFMLKDNWQ